MVRSRTSDGFRFRCMLGGEERGHPAFEFLGSAAQRLRVTRSRHQPHFLVSRYRRVNGARMARRNVVVLEATDCRATAAPIDSPEANKCIDAERGISSATL